MSLLNGRHTVLVRGLRALPRRVRRWLSTREKILYLVIGDRYFSLHWKPHHGIAALAEGHVSAWPLPYLTYPRREKPLTMKRRDALGLAGTPLPGASAVSTILGKLPSLREYMSLTSYEDGTARQVSALRITTRGTLWHLTLTDPDARARLQVQDASLDKALLLMEQLVGVAECPWEPDPYAREVGPKKKK